MARKRCTTEQIIVKLRKAEVRFAQGKTVGQGRNQIGIPEQTYYRWWPSCSGGRLDIHPRGMDSS